MDIDILDFSTSSDDELDELFAMLPDIPTNRIQLDTLNSYSDSEFCMKFRLTKETFMFTLDLISPHFQRITNRGRPLSTSDQLLVALRYYATGRSQIAVGDLISVHKSSVCKIIQNVSPCIAKLRPHFIKMPSTAEEILATKKGFYGMENFPNVIGCIDCTHIRIQSPGGVDAEFYRNRKGYFSINVQAVCNASLFLTEITARWRGSVHDSTIFNESALNADLTTGCYPESYLLGDGGYPCHKYILTPVQTATTASERRYNKAHIGTRNTIERAFDAWKQRFPCLSIGMKIKIDTTLTVIVATAVLHNIAVQHNECEPPMDPDVQIPPEAYEYFNQSMGHQNQMEVRNNVIATAFTN